MPTVGGTDAEKAAIMIVLNKYKHVFGKPPIGGSKLRPMSIELKEGVVLPRPAAARRVSPEILKEIREDTQMRIDNGWMRAAQVGDRRTSMDTAPSCAAPTLRHRIAMPCQHILRAVGTPGAVCARRLGPRRRVRANRSPHSCSTCPARSALLVIPSRMALADDWRGCAARSCRALGSVAAPDGCRSCTASSGLANRRRHRRS